MLCKKLQMLNNIFCIFVQLALYNYTTQSNFSNETQFDVKSKISLRSKPGCLDHPFLQSSLKYGNLVRKFGSSGELVFMDGIKQSEYLEIFLRIHPDKRIENIEYENYNYLDLPSVTSFSLAETLDYLSDEQR